MSSELLSEILWDDDTELILSSSKPLELEKGYELAVKAIDNDGKKVHLELSKNGQVVDSRVIQPSIENPSMSDGTYLVESRGREDRVLQGADESYPLQDHKKL